MLIALSVVSVVLDDIFCRHLLLAGMASLNHGTLMCADLSTAFSPADGGYEARRGTHVLDAQCRV